MLVGGSTILQPPLRLVFKQLWRTAGGEEWSFPLLKRGRLARFLAAFLAAWLSLQLLNSRPVPRTAEENVTSDDQTSLKSLNDVCQSPSEQFEKRHWKAPLALAGRTMDLTLFAVIRAIDVVVADLWSRHRSRSQKTGRWTQVESFLSRTIDAGVFAVGAGAVMWAWVYLPGRLPRAYNRWIGDAAQVDPRLIETLRRIRMGQFVYGENTGQAPLLQGMCKDYGLPLVWGDPAKTIPIPCEIVHMGVGPSCEKHALVRFGRAFKFALAMYLPLQLSLRMRSPSTRAFQQALRDATRSSVFLGSFISIFYYSICLSRTRLGPKIISHSTITPTMWDQGLCINVACAMCGWSILIEAERRRQEIALFVAPRAVATILPRQYNEKVRLPRLLFRFTDHC